MTQGLQVQWKPNVSITQTHRTHKNVTHETVEEEAREEAWKWSELKVYIDMFNTIISISNLSGDTWAIAKRPTIWHYPSPIFFNHFSAHLDIDNDFTQQIANP